ncbi:MAG: hypothetical protein WBP82_09135 [Leuconostoc mesenteroides]
MSVLISDSDYQSEMPKSFVLLGIIVMVSIQLFMTYWPILEWFLGVNFKHPITTLVIWATMQIIMSLASITVIQEHRRQY